MSGMDVDAVVGDVQHHVNPVIGWLRLAEANGQPLSAGQVTAAVDHLYAALAALSPLQDPDATTRPGDVRGTDHTKETGDE